MKLKTTTLGAAIAAALAVGVVGQAHASVYAGSSLDLQNLTIVILDNGAPPATNPVTSFQFTATNTATLNGVSDISAGLSDSCGGSIAANNCTGSPRVNPSAANAPGGDAAATRPTSGATAYSFFGEGALQYSNSNSEITTAQLAGDASSATRQIAESEIQGGDSANANAEITSTTGFVFNFAIASTGSLLLNFEANPSLRALIAQGPSFVNGNAQANILASFSLTSEATGDAVTWSPQGTVANDCLVDAGLAGVTCTEAGGDAEDLNRNLSVAANGSTADFSRTVNPGFGAFGITIAGLSSGNYSLSFNGVTSSSVRQTVPEPGVLALLGIAIAGLGTVTRRKSRT